MATTQQKSIKDDLVLSSRAGKIDDVQAILATGKHVVSWSRKVVRNEVFQLGLLRMCPAILL